MKNSFFRVCALFALAALLLPTAACGVEAPEVSALWERFDEMMIPCHGGDEYITTKEIRAYTRNGASVIAPCRILRRIAVLEDAEGKEEAAFFIDDGSGVGWCIPIKNGGCSALTDCMRRFDHRDVSGAERYALAYQEEDVVPEASEWQTPSAELEKLDITFPMLLDVDGDGEEESIGYEKDSGGWLDHTPSYIIINGNRSECSNIPISIGRLDLDPEDGFAEFYVYGYEEPGHPYDRYTYIYRYANGELESIGRLLGELYGRSGQKGLVSVLHQEGGGAYMIMGYSFELSAEKGGRILLRSSVRADWPRDYWTNVEFEAFSGEGRVTVPKDSVITVLWDRRWPFKNVQRTVYFTYNGEECFVFLDELYDDLNGTPWDEYVSPL